MRNAFPLNRKLRAWVFTLITGTSPPWAIRELFLPPLDTDMPVRIPLGRSLPNPIQTQLKTPISSSSGKDSFPSVGPGAHDYTVVPSYHDSRTRTLVLCFDGTGDQFDADNSNIVHLFSMLKKDDKSQQLVYYQAGIGTYTIPDIATPLVAKWKKTVDMAIANHLDAHVMGGYEFLMEQYHAEDKICIFGFSRGAYTARALAGMIQKVGLLPAGNHQQVPFAYKMYTRDDKTGWDQSITFKKAFSIDVEIEFVGVWDTVCSVGLIPHTLPFTRTNTAIRYFRHAIALDERRAKFKANHYHLHHENDHKGTKLGEMPRSNHRHPYFDSSHHHHHGQKRYSKAHDGVTDVREVWFAGCHCDVGGGSVKNDEKHSLARIPLRWMIRECFRVNTEIQFYREPLKRLGLDPDALLDLCQPALTPSSAGDTKAEAVAHVAEPTDGTLVDLTEESEELEDVRTRVHDQLEKRKAWWILELLPTRFREQIQKDDERYMWKPSWMMNLGRARTVPKRIRDKKEKILVHRSVKTRMDIKELKYEPKVNFREFDYDFVD